MEMWFRLHTMMSIRIKTLCILCACVLLQACKESNQPSINNSGIDGTIDVGDVWTEHPNGFMITLTNSIDESVIHKAVSDMNGSFQFRNLEPGVYSIDAYKEGYEWGWLIDDGKLVGSRIKEITLSKDQVKNVTIYMSSDYYTDKSALDITDLNNNPLSQILIPQNATTISFKLYNGTQSKYSWELTSEYCFGTIDFEVIPVFTSFSISQGYLSPGDNVVIVGFVNPEIFSYKFSWASHELYLSDSGSIKSRRSIWVDIN